MYVEKTIELAEKVYKETGRQAVPKKFLAQALVLILESKESVSRYPNGMPSLHGWHEVATRLEKEHSSVQ